ncbi:hypothetical protein T492DRAFT_1022568 [Pavlovales sp. CCMP2436]|nr:hypothetical protein T492DRAFT_1022568 [Pavlovales sp. CCMP2436]
MKGRYAPARPAFQPAGSRILTPGIAVATTSLGFATLNPHFDKLALSTESEARNRAVREHWAAVNRGERAPTDRVPAAGGVTSSVEQMKAELMGSSLVLGFANPYVDGLEHNPKPRRKLHRASAPLPGDGIGGDNRASMAPFEQLRLMPSTRANFTPTAQHALPQCAAAIAPLLQLR